SLATIRIDAPIMFELPKSSWCDRVDLKKILETFDEFGFRSLKERTRAVITKITGQAIEAETIQASSPQEEIDPTQLVEAEVILWLLASEFTNPSIDDVLAFTKEATIVRAHSVLEKKIGEAGRVKEVYEEIEKPLIPIAKEMGRHGIEIDA